MNETDIMPAPVLAAPTPVRQKFDREKAAFARLLPQLLAEYRDKYVAIHDEAVVASGSDLLEVAHAAYQKFGYQPVYVDLVSDQQPTVVRIPSPRNLGR